MAKQRKGPGRAAWTIGLVAAVLLTTPAAEAGPLAFKATYRVKSGDTLSAIAQAKMRRASHWPRLYALNRQVVGGNPHLIFPGQWLRLDSAGQALAGASSTRPLARASGRLAAAGPKPGTRPQRRPHPIVPLSEEVAFGPRSTVPVTPAEPPASAPETAGSAFGGHGAALAPGEVVTMPVQRAGAPNPWVAAGASLALPGAGQAYVGDWGRGAMYAGAAAAMYGLAFYGMQTKNESLARTGGYALLGLSVAAPIDAFLGAKRKEAQLASEAVKVGGK